MSRRGGGLSTRRHPVLNHETAVLHDLDTGAGESFRGFVVANTGLKPDRFRFLRKDIIDVAVNIPRTAKYIHQIDFSRNVDKAAIDPRAENFADFGVIDRHRNNFVACLEQIMRHINRRLIRLRLGLDTEHGNTTALQNQPANLRRIID